MTRAFINLERTSGACERSVSEALQARPEVVALGEEELPELPVVTMASSLSKQEVAPWAAAVDSGPITPVSDESQMNSLPSGRSKFSKKATVGALLVEGEDTKPRWSLKRLSLDATSYRGKRMADINSLFYSNKPAPAANSKARPWPQPIAKTRQKNSLEASTKRVTALLAWKHTPQTRELYNSNSCK